MSATQSSMTITPEKRVLLKKALTRWFVSAAVVVGFLYYYSAAPLGPVLLGIVGTLIAVVVTTLFWTA